MLCIIGKVGKGIKAACKVILQPIAHPEAVTVGVADSRVCGIPLRLRAYIHMVLLLTVNGGIFDLQAHIMDNHFLLGIYLNKRTR